MRDGDHKKTYLLPASRPSSLVNLRHASCHLYLAQMPLTSAQKRKLRSLAHPLKPVVMLGQAGLTPPVMQEIINALEHHELIKVKVAAGDREERRRLLGHIERDTGSELVQSIGHIGVFYRRHPKKPKIELA